MNSATVIENEPFYTNWKEDEIIPEAKKKFETIKNNIYVFLGGSIKDTERDFDSNQGMDVGTSIENMYIMKEKELEAIIGEKNFQSLDRESRALLINIAGAIDFGVSIDIEETLNYSIYDE